MYSLPQGRHWATPSFSSPSPTPSRIVRLGRISLPQCLSDPPTQDRWVGGRLPRDGGGERRLPMSLRLEGFPDLLRAERAISKHL